MLDVSGLLGRVAVSFLLVGPVTAQAEWQPVQGPLRTRWADQVDPDHVLPEYPRPALQRESWQNLNGLWDYVFTPRRDFDAALATGQLQFPHPEGKILVPFCPESALSGVMKPVGDQNVIWYRRSLPSIPTSDARSFAKKTLLNFGAVDWQCWVLLNGRLLAEHQGGFDPFSVDLTTHLRGDGSDELVVVCWDPTDHGPQPCGKQHVRPEKIWYTAVTGIWQTVWIETVPAHGYLTGIAVHSNIDDRTIVVTLSPSPQAVVEGETSVCRVTVFDGGQPIANSEGRVDLPISIKIPQSKLWSPQDPHLYTLRVEWWNDHVESYFGMRKISVQKDEQGIDRLYLNNNPIFMFGLLDQGWWPEGLYTAPTDDALRYDIEVTRQLGFNMARKHVKVEPQRWYYWCDKLGLLVWQDMPNGDQHIGRKKPDLVRSDHSEQIYRREWEAIIDRCRFHPSIVAWVPFNEGWGQFKTNEILRWTRNRDPGRLVDGPSGWIDRGEGDMWDMHNYPSPDKPPNSDQRAAVLGEFGGLGLPLEGHTWLSKGNWGYRSYGNQQELTAAYEELMAKLPPLIREGLCAAVYTQTTDVEVEVNGLMTYDRAVLKLDPDRLRQIHASVLQSLPGTR